MITNPTLDEFIVLDDWGATIIPGCDNIFKCFRNPTSIAASWSVDYWEEILEDLLGRFALDSQPEVLVLRVKRSIGILHEQGLVTAMHWLLLGLDHTLSEMQQVLQVRAVLQALALVYHQEHSREEVTLLEELEQPDKWSTWCWVDHLGREIKKESEDANDEAR